jgi:hypothetical protein
VKRLATVVLAAISLQTAGAQDVSLEYRVKAAYLFNFTKFVEWPAASASEREPFTICVAETNPFGSVLAETVQGETVAGRPLVVRVARDPAGCQVLFVPADVPADAFLRNVRTAPVLTVGESSAFLRRGGIVNFFLDGGKVRFEIDQAAAERANLRISSRLLRLARAGETNPRGAAENGGDPTRGFAEHSW